MEVSVLYKVEPRDFRKNTSKKCGLLLGGNTVDITLYGSKSRPNALSEMIDLTNGEAFSAEGAYVLSALPSFIYFSGTADIIETINYISLGTFLFGEETPMSETDLRDMGLTSAQIDARLIYLSQLDPALVDITIYIYGNEQRTSASDAAVAILINNGCYIESDYTP